MNKVLHNCFKVFFASSKNRLKMRTTKKRLTKPTSNDYDAGEKLSDFLFEQREKKTELE